MEHEMEAMEEGEMLLDGPPETKASGEQASSQECADVLHRLDAVPRPRQRSRRRHDPARPWKSLPATPTGELEADPPVFFSSMTSLQAEEFFDMVAKVQARRLNDQRADFTEPEGASGENMVVSEDQLYDTILAHQCQSLPSGEQLKFWEISRQHMEVDNLQLAQPAQIHPNSDRDYDSQRLEDQRTEPPIPVGVQGLLDLLFRAQGTRMEDQRSVLPPGLAVRRHLPSPAGV